MKKIRIGGGAGFAGDRVDAAVVLIEKGNLDYIIFISSFYSDFFPFFFFFFHLFSTFLLLFVCGAYDWSG